MTWCLPSGTKENSCYTRGNIFSFIPVEKQVSPLVMDAWLCSLSGFQTRIAEASVHYWAKTDLKRTYLSVPRGERFSPLHFSQCLSCGNNQSITDATDLHGADRCVWLIILGRQNKSINNTLFYELRGQYTLWKLTLTCICLIFAS